MANNHLPILIGAAAAVAAIVIFVVLLVIGNSNSVGFATKPNTPVGQLDDLNIHDLEPVTNVTRNGDDS